MKAHLTNVGIETFDLRTTAHLYHNPGDAALSAEENEARDLVADEQQGCQTFTKTPQRCWCGSILGIHEALSRDDDPVLANRANSPHLR
jgi:hypothetical protein